MAMRTHFMRTLFPGAPGCSYLAVAYVPGVLAVLLRQIETVTQDHEILLWCSVLPFTLL